MQFLKKNGIELAFEDTGTTLPPVVLVHGCGLDHVSMSNQAAYFSRSHRVVSVDLRGHGESDAPHQEYTPAALADDIAWLSNELELVKPAVIGHSMGGNVALEVAAKHPEVPSSVVMIDSVMFPSQAETEILRSQIVEKAAGPNYLEAFRHALSGLCLPTDTRSAPSIAAVKVAQHVVVSALANHTTNYDAVPAASACHVPVAYIFSGMPFLDLARFKSLTPQLISASTLGSGHFSPVEVPDQINAMISQFLKLQ